MRALSDIAKDAMELPPQQRVKLARILLELSEADPDFSPEAVSAWEQEICRRMEAVKAGTAESRSGEELAVLGHHEPYPQNTPSTPKH